MELIEDLFITDPDLDTPSSPRLTWARMLLPIVPRRKPAALLSSPPYPFLWSRGARSSHPLSSALLSALIPCLPSYLVSWGAPPWGMLCSHPPPLTSSCGAHTHAGHVGAGGSCHRAPPPAARVRVRRRPAPSARPGLPCSATDPVHLSSQSGRQGGNLHAPRRSPSGSARGALGRGGGGELEGCEEDGPPGEQGRPARPAVGL